jgi:hypothetical protein
VDGEVIDEPQFKVGDQKVELDKDAKATAPEPVTILLNVPAGMDVDTAMAIAQRRHPQRRAPLRQTPAARTLPAPDRQRRPASQGQRPAGVHPGLEVCAN